MKIAGIGHDLWIASSALFIDGNFKGLRPEERFNRLKGYQGFPKLSLESLLIENHLTTSELDLICVGWNPAQYFNCLHPRFSKTPRWRAEMMYAIPNYIQSSLTQSIDPSYSEVSIEHLHGKIRFYDHHKCHSYCSHFLSGYDESLNISLDGRGERRTTSINVISGMKFNEISHSLYPESLGLFYGAFTQYCGFKPHSDEWKFMALAALSTEDNEFYRHISQIIDQLIWIEGLSLCVDMRYFSYDQPDVYGQSWTKPKLAEKLGINPLIRWGESVDNIPLNCYYLLAKCVQARFESIVHDLIHNAINQTGVINVTLTGGCAMNSVCNGKLHMWFPNANFYIPPYPDDTGISLGAAVLGALDHQESLQLPSIQAYTYTGKKYSDEEVIQILGNYKISHIDIQDDLSVVAELISDGNLIAVFNSQSESGQRALGNRSILGDPRNPKMKETLNMAVKYREKFRPFAPAVLEEHANNIFEDYVPSYFMERVLKVKPIWKERIPAIVHYDNTARLQTVSVNINPRFHKLIFEFYCITDIPVLINTSFNLNTEPNVETPTDAIRTFFSCGLDYLLINNFLIGKK